MFLWTPAWYMLLIKKKYFLSEIALTVLLLISLGKTPLPQNFVNAYYILGAYIGINFCNLADIGNRKISVLASVDLPIIIFLGGNYAGHFLYNCCFFVIIWMVLDLFEYKNDIKWWIKCTFYYYCAHDMILETIEKVILLIGGRSYFMAIFDYIMAPAMTLLILIEAAVILRKRIPPIWNLLNGGR